MAKRKTYCVCRTADDSTPMVACGPCGEWYHLRCVGLTDADVERLGDKDYVCASCAGPSADETAPTTAKRARVAHKAQRRASHSEEDARRTVAEGISSALAVDCDAGDALSGVAKAVEHAMYVRHGGDASSAAYRQHYRMLVANLRAPANGPLRAAVCGGKTTPDALAAMDAAELASPDVSQVREATEREMLVASIKVEDAPAPVSETALDRVLTVESSAPPAFPTAAVQAEPARSAAGPGSSAAASAPPETATSALGWEGTLVSVDTAERRRVGRACVLGGSCPGTAPAVHGHMPVNLHVAGRIAAEHALRYVCELWASSTSRAVAVVGLADLGEHVVGSALPASAAPSRFCATLGERWAVVAHDPAGGLRDVYVAPVSAAARLPPLGLSPAEVAERYAMLVVFVYARDPRAPVPPDPNRAANEYDPLAA